MKPIWAFAYYVVVGAIVTWIMSITVHRDGGILPWQYWANVYLITIEIGTAVLLVHLFFKLLKEASDKEKKHERMDSSK